MAQLKKMMIGLYLLGAALMTIQPVQAEGALSPSLAEVEPFPIGIHWPQRPEQSQIEHFQGIKDMNATFIVGGNGWDTFPEYDVMLDFARQTGLKVLVQDLHTSPRQVYGDNERPADAQADEIAAYYRDHEHASAFLGHVLVDEPSANMMPALQHISQRMKTVDPGHMTYVNLYPNLSDPGRTLGVLDFTGEIVNEQKSVGQLFTTAPNQTFINGVQLWIDAKSWGNGETLTLRLWDSVHKESLLAEKTLEEPVSNWPLFQLNAAVSENTPYYLELTHNGAGNNEAGWVVRSKDGVDWYHYAEGYVNGQPINGDFWFTLNQNIQGGTYEDYVYRWVSHAPDVLSFDHYPFRLSNGETILTEKYFDNLEIIRRQALYGDIPFWSYIQSVGISHEGIKVPERSELYFQVYTSLAYGAKGIIYFTYLTPNGTGFHGGLLATDGTPNPTYALARELNQEVLKLGPILQNTVSEAVYHTGEIPLGASQLPGDSFFQPQDGETPLVLGFFRDDNDSRYVMAVNRDTENERNITFNFPEKPGAVKEISKSSGLAVETDYHRASGTLTADFGAGEGRLYLVEEGENLPSVYTLQYMAGPNGQIMGQAQQQLEEGEDGQEVTAKADANYRFVRWSDGVATASRTDRNVQGDLTVTAQFERQSGASVVVWEPASYTLTYTAGPYGRIEGAATQTVRAGEKGSRVKAVADEGHRFVKWSDGVTAEEREEQNVQVSLKVIAEFEIMPREEETPGKSELAPQLQDLSEHWGRSLIEEAVQREIVNGYEDGTFRPDQQVTREELLVMLQRASGVAGSALEREFTDRSSISPWAREAVGLAVREGWISGYEDGSLRPGQAVSRAELAVLLGRYAGLAPVGPEQARFADNDEIPLWAKGYAAAAVVEGILEGREQGRFAPLEKTTRAEAAVVLIRLLHRES